MWLISQINNGKELNLIKQKNGKRLWEMIEKLINGDLDVLTTHVAPIPSEKELIDT